MIEIKEEWSCKKLDEIGTIGRGKSKHRPRNDPRLYGGKYPFIQTSDVKNAELYLSRYSQTYNEEGLKQSKLWNPNTLCITIAAHIAETAILKINACFPDSIVGFVADENKADIRFIKYYIDIIKLQMQNVSKGTTQDNLSLDKLLTFDFLLPPLETQKKIASILSSYDELIENNTRRIEILEEMAKLVYEEWFVKFRFPGHENVKMVSSELGESPKGWETKKLREIVSFYIGGGWGKESREDKFPIGAYVIRGTDIPSVKLGIIENIPYRFHKVSNFKSRKLENFDIVFEVSGGSKDQPVGRSILITEERLKQINDNVMCASFCKMIRIKDDISPYYLDQIFQLMYDTREINKYQTQSTGISNFKFEHFIDEVSVIIPPPELLSELHNLLEPLYKEIGTLGTKNQNLRKTHDLLLPKLISGEIDVSDMDIHIRNEFQES